MKNKNTLLEFRLRNNKTGKVSRPRKPLQIKNGKLHVEGYTIELYTGQKDSGGKKLYQHDKVKIRYYRPSGRKSYSTHTIFWDNIFLWWGLTNKNGGHRPLSQAICTLTYHKTKGFLCDDITKIN